MLRALALACYHVRFYQPNVLVGNVTTRPTLKMRLDKLKKKQPRATSNCELLAPVCHTKLHYV